MTNYAIAYYVEPQFGSSETGQVYQEQWMAWINNLGDAVVTPAMPLGKAKTLRNDGSIKDEATSERLTGLTVVKADSLDAAVEMAKGCPHLEHGYLDIAEIYEM